VDRHHPALRAADAACTAAFGAAPALVRSGGTIPVVSALQDVLGVPTVLMGFTPPDARIHAPNERFPLTTFFKAIAACGRFLEETVRVPFRHDLSGSGRVFPAARIGVNSGRG
jgi:acetylornithine deacetylase/succinyl-diaminopimelate desuccinylase-like protein